MGGNFTDEPYGIGMKKGKTDLKAFVDQVLNNMLADGRWEDIYDEYLGGIEGLATAEEAKNNLPND